LYGVADLVLVSDFGLGGREVDSIANVPSELRRSANPSWLRERRDWVVDEER
jgi:hypothetical protein